MSFLEGIWYMMWRGVAIGVIISAPMGPVGILCVQRTLEKGRRTGFFTGVGAALSDLFYCLVTGFGLSFIEGFLKANQNIIQIIGSVVLVIFGIYLFKSNPARQLKKPGTARTSRSRDVMQGFLFTFSNPLIIFLIIGLFARFNFLLPEITFIQYVTGFVFVILGALGWWWLVTYFVDKVRSHFNLRSMWLINKITGSIIMIFALVGIITAFAGSSEAATRQSVFLSSARGFGELGEGNGNALIISNRTDSIACRMTALPGVGEAEVSMRVSNLCSHARVPWGIRVTGGGHRLDFMVGVRDNKFDELYPPEMTVSAYFDGERVGEKIFNDGFDSGNGPNSLRVITGSGVSSISIGNRRYECDFLADTPGLNPDSIGLVVSEGGEIAVDYVSMEITAPRFPEGRRELSHFADPDVRRSYFSRSSDMMEGIWEIFDRTFDDTSLRSGGNYRIALVADRNGYQMLYLDGAVKNSAQWRAGATKGRLNRTSFSGVYDVMWLNPSGQPLDGEIKAQFSSPDLLTVQFAGHGSVLRMRKVEEKYSDK